MKFFFALYVFMCNFLRRSSLVIFKNVFVCVLPVVQYQEADNGSGLFGLQWDQGEECNNNVTQ